MSGVVYRVSARVQLARVARPYPVTGIPSVYIMRIVPRDLGSGFYYEQTILPTE